MNTVTRAKPLSSADVKALQKAVPEEPLSPVVSCSTQFELKIKIIEFTWKSGIKVTRENEAGALLGWIVDRITAVAGYSIPHWTDKDSATIPEENKPGIQHYHTGSKRPGVYLIRNKGADTAEVKINIFLTDPKGEVASKKYKLRCELGSLTKQAKKEKLTMESVGTFTMTSGNHTVTMKFTKRPDTLQHYEGNAIFDVFPEDGKGCSEFAINKPRLEVFFVYDNPNMMKFYKDGVWVEALRLLFKKAGVADENEPKTISTKVTEYCHSKHGMKYDTELGAPKFMRTIIYNSRLGGAFYLRKYIEKKNFLGNSYTILNCYDSAAAVQTLCGALGVNTQWIFQDPFGYIIETDLVGVGSCNNPFFSNSRYSSEPVTALNDPQRSGFGNHAFVAAIPEKQNIRDACAGPHVGDEDLREYLKETIDFDALLTGANATLTPEQREIFINNELDALFKATDFSGKVSKVIW